MERGNLALKYNGVFLTIQEVAKELGLTKNDIVSLVENNQLRAVLIANRYRFRVSDVERFALGETSGELKENAVSLYKEKPNDTLNKAGAKKMMGSITETNGRFIVQFSLGKGENGKRKRESKTFKSRELAEDYRQKRSAELNQDIVNKEFGEYTFNQYLEYFLELNVKGAKSRSIAGYSYEAQAVAKYIGEKKIMDITTDDLVKIFAELAQIYKENVLRKKWMVTKMIFKYATDMEHIFTNPMKIMERPGSEVFSPKESKAYTNDELLTILCKAEKNIELYTIFRVLLSSGIRPAELRALNWLDFNEKMSTITINKAVTRKYQIKGNALKANKYIETIDSPKTKSGIRTIKLSPNATAALVKWRDYLYTYETNEKKDSKYIFPGPDGSFTKEKTFSNRIYKFTKENGLADIGVTPYRFRHTFCTNHILQKTPDDIVLRLLGDKSLTMIKEVYTHIADDDTVVHSDRLYSNNHIY